MKGPSNNDRQRLESALKWLELGLVFAGGIVVAGLLTESGPAIVSDFAKYHRPQSGTIGEALVTIGVAAEVILGIFISRIAGRIQERANASIAEANDRALKLESANLHLRTELEQAIAESRSKQIELAEAHRAAAEAQLELKRYVNAIASAQGPRSINDDLFRSILQKAPPKRVEVMYLGGAPETFMFAGHILSLLRMSGWKCDSPNPEPIDSMVNIGEGGTGLTEILVAMCRTEISRDESTTEGALWNAILSLRRGCGQIQDKSMPEDLFKLYVGPTIGPTIGPLR